jgi:hypothetical protein
MTHTGILVPVDPTAAHRLITWEDTPSGDGLLRVLYRELGDTLDASTVMPGRVRLWSQDTSLNTPDPAYNDRAIAVCRALGYDVAALAGPIVFIGAVRGEDEAGLSPAMLAILIGALERMREFVAEAARLEGRG